MIKKNNISEFSTTEELYTYLLENQDNNVFYKNVLKKFEYECELLKLQSQLVNLQNWIFTKNKKVAVIFEGRDASGKGGTIRRFRQHLNPRTMHVVALNKPTEVEKNQWYFNRYIKKLPNAGEIVFFDRSWYNRAVVEPVMGFCSNEQYEQFMVQVSEFEHMLYESGTTIIKLWFSVSKQEQQRRFESRLKNPLKRWKYSPIDAKGQELWDDFSYYINQMFTRTHNSFSPWIIVDANDKNIARLESIRYVLSLFNYEGKMESNIDLMVDPNIIRRYYRLVKEV